MSRLAHCSFATNTGSAGPVFAALCALALLWCAPAARAQSPMPLVSPLKPVNTVADSVPLPVIEDPAAEGFEELIVELRAGREASRSEFAFAREGHMWVPAVAMCELVELRVQVDSTGVLSAMLDPDGLGLNLYPREREAWRGNHYRLTHEDDLFFHEGRLYAKAVDLAWMLDTHLFESFSEMTVIFDGIEHLPLGRRIRRERMRRIEDAWADEPDVIYGPERRPWSGATLDWSVGASSLEQPERSSYLLGFGGAVFGGAAEARYRGQADGRGPEDFDARWQGVWPEQAWLRQLELGGTRGTGPRGRAIDGISLGNSPFLRDSEFGETVLRGELEPGWEVEVYRDGRLLAWDRVDDRGRWEFTVPLDYGQNPVEVRAYGPNGQVQITERAVRVDFDRIPAGTFEYGLSAGRTDFRDADVATNADLRYGINRSWTARAGYEGYHTESGRNLHHPYVSLTGAVIDPVRVGVERVVDAWWSTAASLESSTRFRLGLRHLRYDRQGASEVLVNPGERDRTTLDFFWRPWQERRGVFFDFDAERVRTSFDRRSSFAVGGTTFYRGVRTSGQLKESFDRSDAGSWRRSALALQGSMILRSGSRAWWHGTQLRLSSEIDIGTGRRDWVQLQFGRRLGRNARIEVGAGWFRELDAPQLTVSLSSAGSWAYVNAWAAGRDGASTARLNAEGSLYYQPDRGRVEAYPYRSLGRGGLSGRVFVDANGNGRFDSGEQLVPGARLIAGSLVTETDADGRYSIWNLMPFEAADIQVEPSSLRNPLWVPAFDRGAVAVAPNGFRQIDLPLVEALEVEGVVRTRVGGAMHCAGAVPLTLTAVDGDREYRTRCFSDGEFYLVGVVPGRYRIEIDETWLRMRGLRVAPASADELVAPAGAGVVEFELVLEPDVEG